MIASLPSLCIEATFRYYNNNVFVIRTVSTANAPNGRGRISSSSSFVSRNHAAQSFGHSIHMTAGGINSTGNWTQSGNFASTGTLTNNGKDVGSDHQHLDSGGDGLSGVPQ